MDLQATGANPGTEYLPAVGPPAPPYNEDRQVTLTGGPTQVYRTYNATFDATNQKWTAVDTTEPAYANVQSPDGSIHYYTLNTTTGLWEGSGNNTIYNAVDFGANASGMPSNNTTALMTMFTAIANATPPGGRVWIPQSSYNINSSGTGGIAIPYCAVIEGLGTGGQKQGTGASDTYHFLINGTGTGFTGNIAFSLTGSHNSGGTIFQNLGVEWVQGGSNASGDVCINSTGAWRMQVQDCFFTDCPTAANVSTLSSGLIGCGIDYGVHSHCPNNAVAVVLQAPETFAVGGGVMEYAQASVVSGGPTGCVGVMVCGGTAIAEHCTIKDLHLSEWSYGVCFNCFSANYTGVVGLAQWWTNSLQDGSEYTVIENVECDAFFTGLYIQPKGSGGQIYGVKSTDCFWIKSQGSTDAAGRPIVFIDTQGGANSNVSDINLIGCTIFSNVNTGKGGTPGTANLYAVQINTGNAIKLLGCKIGNMGTTASVTTDGTANIAITGACGDVQIENCHLQGTTPEAVDPHPSEWALLISGSPSGTITVDNCNMGGPWGSAGPVGVTGTIAAGGLYIRNCTGYNDLNTPVASGHMTGDYPTSTTGNTAATAGALTGGTDYYGPSLVIFTVGSSSLLVYINGVTSTYPANSVGTVFLNSPYDQFYFAAAPAHFNWIGK